MTDSLKFGPEWLRMSAASSTTNSGGSNPAAMNATNTAPRYPLSEFRYGREEMLALFDKNVKHPEILPRYKNLFVEKLQCPLALTPTAEDDPVAARMWPMRSSPGLSARGGRGGLMDRGRGRGRGAYHSVSSGGFSRFPEEEARALGRGERWSERNGADPEWASGLPSTSPRKEYNSHGRGTGLESWRRPRGEDEPLEQWRSGSLGPREPTKWGRSTSWREEDPALAEPRGYNNERGGYVDGQRGGLSRTMGRRPWEVPEDNLPEWAVDNPLESGGSFDATGAFHGSDDELEGHGRMDKHNYRRRELNGGVDKDDERGGRTLSEGDSGKEPSTDPPTAAPSTTTNNNGTTSDASKNAEAASESPASDAVAASSNAAEVPESDDATKQRGDQHLQAQNVDRMQEVADDMVEKLIMDDELLSGGGGNKEKKDEKLAQGGLLMGPKNPIPVNETEWFYRDPQDMVQGPFSAVEMAEWYQAGYFDNNLCVRRKNDQRFCKLGELIDMCGGEMPFFVAYRALPLPVSPVDVQMKGPPILPHRVNPLLDMDPAAIDPRLLRQNYIAQQQALVYQKLSSSDMWHMLSPEQQRQMIRKHVAQLPPMPESSLFGHMPSPGIAGGDSPLPPFGLFDMMNKPPPPLDGSVDSALLQQNLLAAKKMQQQRILPPGAAGPTQPGAHLPMMPSLPQDFAAGVMNHATDPLNQMMHNMRLGAAGGFPPQQGPQVPPMMPPGGNSAAENDRIKSLLMQLSMHKGVPQMMVNHPHGHLQKQAGGASGGMPVPWSFDPLKAGMPGGVPGAPWMTGPPGENMPNGPSVMDNLAGRANPPQAQGGVGGGIWELEHKLFSGNNNAGAAQKPIEMKTEKQIIEEQQAAMQAMLMQQKEKDKETLMMDDQQQQQMLQQQFEQQQQQQQAQMANEVSAGGDKGGWTKVEAKGAPGSQANQKDKKGDDKNGKKKDATAKPGQQAQQPKKEDAAKQQQKPMSAQEASKQQQQQQMVQQQQQQQKGKTTPWAVSDRLRSSNFRS